MHARTGVVEVPTSVCIGTNFSAFKTSPSSTLGLNLRPIGFIEGLETLNVSNRLQSISGTPTNVSTSLPLHQASESWNLQSLTNATDISTTTGQYTPFSDVSDSAKVIQYHKTSP